LQGINRYAGINYQTMNKTILTTVGLMMVFTMGFLPASYAADLESRQWSHLPMGTNFAGIGYAYTRADISLDPALLIENAEVKLQTWGGSYVCTFELFDKSARIDLKQAYHKGEWEGILKGAPASVTREGFSDTFVRFAVNLYGAPPLRGKEFAEYRSKTNTETILGVGLVVRLPTGEYMEDKLINLGNNRFAFRPQIGGIRSWGKWTLEAMTQVAFYTDNDEFFDGNKLEQEPLSITHGNLIYNFKPGLWAGVAAGFDYGGEKTINGIKKNDTKEDIAWALSFAYPITRQYGFKIVYIGSRTQVSTGLDTDSLSVALSGYW
jgi:hypothetical protein